MGGEKLRASAMTPAGVRDVHGAKAEAVLVDKLKVLLKARGRSAEARSAVLRDRLAAQMVLINADPNKSRRTLDSYNRVAKVLVGESGSCTSECKHLGGLRADEVTAADFDDILADIAERHGRVTATQAKTLLKRVGQRLVREEAWSANLVREVELEPAPRRSPVRALHLAEARELLANLATSDAPLPPMSGAKKDHTAGRTVAEFAESVDLVDPITVALYLGLRRSELLGLLWSDFDREDRTLTVCHQLFRAGRVGGEGTELVHQEGTKTESSKRVIALPDAIVELLDRRRGEYLRGARFLALEDARGNDVPKVIFPNTAGLLRDPDTFASQWRRVRGPLGVEWMGLHAFRKSTATILKELGYSDREIADILGHHHIDETNGVYIAPGDEPHHDIAARFNAAMLGS